MNKVYDRVCKWNAQRYDRVLDIDLACGLLSEELDEFLEATTEVDKLDALCDITFVAFGILWKSNSSPAELENATNIAYNTLECLLEIEEDIPLVAYMVPYIMLASKKQCSMVTAASLAASLALSEMSGMMLTLEQLEEAMLVVCDSNDSKSIKKTAPNVKANAGDKGPYFVAPEPRLQEILNART